MEEIENQTKIIKKKILNRKDDKDEDEDTFMEAQKEFLREQKRKQKEAQNNNNNNKDQQDNYQSPSQLSWDEAVDMIINDIEEYGDNFDRNFEKELGSLHFRKNFCNFNVVFSFILEFLGIAFLAFRPSAVQWGFSEIALIILNIFFVQFVISMSLVLIFALAILFANRYLRKGIFGVPKESQSSGFCQFIQSVISWLINFIGWGLIFWISKNLFDSFSCDYPSVPINLYQDPSLVCLEPFQLGLLISGSIGLFVFFLISIFPFASLQFGDKSLDLREYPVSHVASRLLRLILACAAAFLYDQSTQIAFFSVSIAILVVIVLIRPSILPSADIIRSAPLILAVFMHIGALITESSQIRWIGFLLIGIGCLVFIIIVVYAVFIKLTMKRIKQRQLIVMEAMHSQRRITQQDGKIEGFDQDVISRLGTDQKLANDGDFDREKINKIGKNQQGEEMKKNIQNKGLKKQSLRQEENNNNDGNNKNQRGSRIPSQEMLNSNRDIMNRNQSKRNSQQVMNRNNMSDNKDDSQGDTGDNVEKNNRENNKNKSIQIQMKGNNGQFKQNLRNQSIQEEDEEESKMEMDFCIYGSEEFQDELVAKGRKNLEKYDKGLIQSVLEQEEHQREEKLAAEKRRQLREIQIQKDQEHAEMVKKQRQDKLDLLRKQREERKQAKLAEKQRRLKILEVLDIEDEEYRMD